MLQQQRQVLHFTIPQRGWLGIVVMAIVGLCSGVLTLQVARSHGGTPPNVKRGLQRHRGQDGSACGMVECLHRFASTETRGLEPGTSSAGSQRAFLQYVVALQRQCMWWVRACRERCQHRLSLEVRACCLSTRWRARIIRGCLIDGRDRQIAISREGEADVFCVKARVCLRNRSILACCCRGPGVVW